MSSDGQTWPRGMPVPMAAADSGGAIVRCNDAFAARFGKSAGRSLDDLGIAKELAEDANGTMRRTSIRGEDGSALDCIVSLWRSAEGGLEIAVLPDDMLPAEDLELRELARFPLINPSPVLRFDPQSRIVACNPAADLLFDGTNLARALWTEICPGIDDAFWHRVMNDSPPPSIEVEVGGETIRFEHVRAPGGNVVTAFGIATTDFRRAEQALAEKAAELTELARFPDMNPGPVIRTDIDGKVLLANVAAREIFGGTLLDCNWHDVCPKVSASDWESVLASPEAVAIEARVGGRDYVFYHRADPATKLVFVYGTDVTRQKLAEQALRQTEKMATLGTLAAGVTHELNNPAAATRRAAEQLGEKLISLEAAHLAFNPASLGEAAAAKLRSIVEGARKAGSRAGELDAMAQSDSEAELEDWLEDNGVDNAWEVAGDLVSAGLAPTELQPIADDLTGKDLRTALEWVAAAYNVSSLAHTVGQGASRLSEIVGALKGYAYLGQAPIQEVDLTEGIENTLVILRSKLKYGITVRRDYAPDMPSVPAYGSELNQVWTNLLDNAADAMNEKGEITIRVRAEGNDAIVEIEDDGPGIPPDIQNRLFDPFFTTKPPGKGMGLGLSTSYSIVTDKHKGQLSVTSEPGSTRFVVKLPLVAAQQNADE